MIMRSAYCGKFGEEMIGAQASACGWVQSVRDMGGVIFLDLGDKTGVLQVVCDAALIPGSNFSVAAGLRVQSCISVRGNVRRRDAETVNPKIPTGTVELAADSVELLSPAQPLPYPIEDGDAVREELRLRYRYLDLRRQSMQENLKFRYELCRSVRSYLDRAEFTEVETPMLSRSTPEGARDYLVPSRVHPGTFYALPQSPQIFKQLLMVGGLDRYYQVARCFRDEDLRADRQPEFTQVDMEMSFVTQEDVLVHLESLFKFVMQDRLGIAVEGEFPRITWKEAMDVYGSDKPDLRFGLEITDLTDLARESGFPVFRSTVAEGGVVRAINVRHTEFSRTDIDAMTAVAMETGAKGMAWIAVRENRELYSALTKYFTPGEREAILDRMGAEPGDFILFDADRESAVRKTLGTVRLWLGDRLGLRTPGEYRFLIVTDFPQFEYSEEEGRYLATHHPFTMPYPEDLPYIKSDPGRVRAQAYDVVLNGTELGSGSVRIHRPEVQAAMFDALGFTEEMTREKFGFLIDAFRYGTPPHAGFAFGLDRLAMLLLGVPSLREVIAFPKVRDGSCLMSDAPNLVDEEQLTALGLGAAAPVPTAGKRSESAAGGMNPRYLARLSRLQLTEEEGKTLPQELASIVSFAAKLTDLPDSGDDGELSVSAPAAVLREDRATPSFDRKTLLDASPKHNDSAFIVGQTF